MASTLRHDPGLAAIPRLWHKTEVERGRHFAPLLLILAIACTAAIARAACDPHPMEHFDLRPDQSQLLGSDSCELRAESATQATLRCGEHTYHLTWVAP
jgi:hypothetical protein